MNTVYEHHQHSIRFGYRCEKGHSRRSKDSKVRLAILKALRRLSTHRQ